MAVQYRHILQMLLAFRVHGEKLATSWMGREERNDVRKFERDRSSRMDRCYVRDLYKLKLMRFLRYKFYTHRINLSLE